ncbi:MAG: CotH kinase family protein, partial [Clostridia bacterium]|nr:CotH kinase family protein [Clostridia bacterium]
YLGQQIFGSDGYYCSDYRQVELYLNNVYWGVYLLAEQQQVNENRIAITEPDDIEKGYQGTDIGYFLEFDGYYNLEAYSERFSCNYNYLDQNSWSSSPLTLRNGYTVYPNQFGFTIKSDVYFDEGNEANCAQKHFIKNYTWNLYRLCYEAVYNHTYYQFNADKTALVPYTPVTGNPVEETVSKVIDIRSLVDTYIMNEIVCDFDIEWSSFLMDVDFGPNAKDNLLRFEAPWDFDSAFGLRYACENATGLYAANKNNPWLLIFINEDWFWNQVKEKWQEMNEANVQADALQYLRTLEEMYSTEYYTDRNFAKWGFVINGESTWEIQQFKGHGDAANHLYNWLRTRFSYLDSVWNS